MDYILNFDTKKIAEINKKNLEVYKVEVARVKGLDLTPAENKKLAPKKLILDAEDLLILRYIHRLVKAEGMVTLDKASVTYTLINYKNLFEEYEGILFMEKCALNIRLNKYVDMGLIVRHTERNEKGTFSYIAQTGLENLIHIETKKVPVDSNGKTPVYGQVHFTEVAEDIEAPIDEEAKADFNLRVEQIERVLTTKASRKLKSHLSRFKNQADFFNYFDNFIVPMLEDGRNNTCDFMVKNINLYLNGEIN